MIRAIAWAIIFAFVAFAVFALGYAAVHSIGMRAGLAVVVGALALAWALTVVTTPRGTGPR